MLLLRMFVVPALAGMGLVTKTFRLKAALRTLHFLTQIGMVSTLGLPAGKPSPEYHAN